ncbi:Helicase [Zea mays]|uniref:Helicase n=1 Tax=Zea mays TaxID=4577 RepID=A0A1D6E3M1_MAIZE|nr:Helicase [Zea mays]
MFVGTLVKKYADGLCLSGGSPCKWYINPDVPEACALMASARKAHSPIKWNEVVSSNQPMPHVPEEQKIACIRDLHPFENKDREFLVTVTIKKIGYRWWYNACKKCTRTTVAHGDSYKCSDQVCATIGTPNQRYKLLLTAGDETGDTDFILFGRMAQCIIKRPCDMLIANNPTGFIPNPITDLLEKTSTQSWQR